MSSDYRERVFGAMYTCTAIFFSSEFYSRNEATITVFFSGFEQVNRRYIYLNYQKYELCIKYFREFTKFISIDLLYLLLYFMWCNTVTK